MSLCPCCSNKPYASCCEKFLTGAALPQTPEELMRSRYTAYSQANIEYIAQTMKGPAAQGFNPQEAKTWVQQVTWLGLEVLQSKSTPPLGWVEFIAHFSEQGIKQNIRELSEFHLEDGRWFYIEQKQTTKAVKIGRNDACSCGSQKKYKKCCGAK